MVSATTSRKASVSRAWHVRGKSRRRPFGRWTRPSGRSALGEGVADTSHRQDEDGRRRVVLDLVAQVADVHVDGLLVLVERLVVAQQLEQLATGVDTAGSGREMAQDLELGRREADAPGPTLHAATLQVDDEILVADDPAAGGVREVAVRPTE